MTADPGTITLRMARLEDARAVWAWNFAPDVRAASTDPRPVTLADHIEWWCARLATADRRTWIIERDAVGVGVIRLDPDHDGARISLAIDAAARGRGIGRRAIALACASWNRSVTAEIANTNRASRAAFAAAGFHVVPIRIPGTSRETTLYLWSP